MNLFNDAYRGRRVLLTGHTGFKGSWLALWLSRLGANVTGAALAPATTPSHWAVLKTGIEDRRIDIRDEAGMSNLVKEAEPEIVFHLAAQSLVRHSYSEPVQTWASNVMGTCHLLEACRRTETVRAIVVVTTDKCYENREWIWGYRENDALGGHDPYSASKAGTEMVAASYRASFFSKPGAPLLATARAGNVIGGGDWSQDRLLPDLVRAVEKGASLEIRSPNATRPWQHVLESLAGYLLLGQRLLAGDGRYADAWNFGPPPLGNRRVADVLTKLNQYWPQAKWHLTSEAQPHEAGLLSLDSTKASTLLDWHPVWQLDDALRYTADWYQTWIMSKEVISIQQLEHYIKDAAHSGASWCSR